MSNQNLPDPNILATLKKMGLTDQVKMLEKRLGFNLGQLEVALDKFVGVSNHVIELKSMVRKLAVHDDPVLIQGDTGTGKEVLARALASSSTGPFIAINCAGMPRELIESELFGYAKGSFTGASADRDGLFKQAGNGTLFLDEVGDMPLDMQAKLLRVLQERTVRPVGGVEEKKIECRFIAASHFNLAELVEQKLFRRDLLARLSTFVLKILPLSKRYDDAIAIWNSLGGVAIKGEQIDWSKVNFDFNVRGVLQLHRRLVVLDEKPPLIK